MGDNPGLSGARPKPRALPSRESFLALLRGRSDRGSRATADVTGFEVAGRDHEPRNVHGLWELETRARMVPQSLREPALLKTCFQHTDTHVGLPTF